MISVVIPTYHRNDLLARCLDRLTPGQQSLASSDYEVIVTDDGSAETARALIAKSYPWARWLAGPRRGPAANRNEGVRQARGKWIAFTDDDCVPSGKWLSSYVNAIKEPVEFYEGRTTCEQGLSGFFEDAPINLTGGIFPSCNLMVSRRLFDEVGGFDENFLPDAMMEDIDFRERVFAGDRSRRFVPEAVVDHPPRRRITGQSAGARWENRVYYDCKWNVREEFHHWLPSFVFKVRMRQMLDEQRLLDYPAAMRSMVTEVLYVIRNVGRWQQRYSRCGEIEIANKKKSKPTS